MELCYAYYFVTFSSVYHGFLSISNVDLYSLTVMFHPYDKHLDCFQFFNIRNFTYTSAHLGFGLVLLRNGIAE